MNNLVSCNNNKNTKYTLHLTNPSKIFFTTPHFKTVYTLLYTTVNSGLINNNKLFEELCQIQQRNWI